MVVETEDNDAFSTPRASTGLRSITKHDCASSDDRHSLELSVRKERYMLTVWRPERTGCLGGSFHAEQPVGVETPDKEIGAFGRLERNNDRAPIRSHYRGTEQTAWIRCGSPLRQRDRYIDGARRCLPSQRSGKPYPTTGNRCRRC